MCDQPVDGLLKHSPVVAHSDLRRPEPDQPPEAGEAPGHSPVLTTPIACGFRGKRRTTQEKKIEDGSSSKSDIQTRGPTQGPFAAPQVLARQGNGGMIKVAEIESIRWRHFREGVSVRGLARLFQR